MEKQKVTKAWRLPPCPDYDIEGTESWLENMALEGLFLAENGFFGGIARFARQTPRPVRYRLAATPEAPSLLNDYDDPPEEQVELSAELGWDYVCRRGSFYIFRTADPDARELDTDPQVQALALRAVAKRERRKLFWMLLYPLLFTLPRRLLSGAAGILMSSIQLGTGFVLFSAGLLVWFILGNLVSIVQLEKLRRRLREQGSLDHRRDWKKSALVSRVIQVLKPLLLALWLLLFGLAWYRDATGFYETPLSDFGSSVPFATLADFSGGDYRLEEHLAPNTVKLWSDPLAPTNVKWKESAAITLPGGSTESCLYYAEYHQAANPWLARQLAEEYLRYDRRGDYEALETPPVAADWCAAYLDDIHFPNLILQKGDQVLHVKLIQFGEEPIPLEDWAGILAESLRAGDS